MGQKEVPPLTTYEISNYLHADLSTVIKWCELGKIRAYRTPGGHRRVRSEDFLAFLKHFEEICNGNKHASRIYAKVIEGYDLDSDGIVDAVEILE